MQPSAVSDKLTLFRLNLTKAFRFFITHLFGVNKWVLLMLLCTISFAVTYISNSLLINENLLMAFYGNQMSAERVHEMLIMQEKYSWLIAPLTVSTYIIRIFCVTCCISLGLFLGNIRHSISKLFGIVTVSEVALLFPSLIKLCWFAFMHQNYTLREVQVFFPLSMLNLFNTKNLDSYLIYPLQLLNFFEFIYVLLIAFGVYACGYTGSLHKGFKIVSLSYLLGLLSWVLVVVFISISL